MADFFIRPAADSDVDWLLELQRDSPEAAQWTVAQYQRSIVGDSGLVCRIADWDGSVAGMIVFRGPVAGETEILNLAVAPPFRRRGIGKALVDAACVQPADFFLEVRRSNQRGISFYRKCGFHPAGQRKDYYRDPVEDALVMTAGECGSSGAVMCVAPSADGVTGVHFRARAAQQVDDPDR